MSQTLTESRERKVCWARQHGRHWQVVSARSIGMMPIIGETIEFDLLPNPRIAETLASQENLRATAAERAERMKGVQLPKELRGRLGGERVR